MMKHSLSHPKSQGETSGSQGLVFHAPTTPLSLARDSLDSVRRGCPRALFRGLSRELSSGGHEVETLGNFLQRQYSEYTQMRCQIPNLRCINDVSMQLDAISTFKWMQLVESC